MPQKPLTGTSRPRALSQIKLNDILDSDLNTSSEDELRLSPQIHADDAHSVVGFSIGPQQAHLTSPKTPRVEKVAAIEEAGGFFEPGVSDLVDHTQEEADAAQGATPDSQSAPTRGRTEKQQDPTIVLSRPQHHRLPSPWRAVPKNFQEDRVDKQWHLLPEGFRRRRRASSGYNQNFSSLDQFQRAFMSNFSGFQRQFSPFTSRRSIASPTRTNPVLRAERSSSLLGPGALDGSCQTKLRTTRSRSDAQTRDSSDPLLDKEQSQTSQGARSHEDSLQDQRVPQPSLQRAESHEDSLPDLRAPPSQVRAPALRRSMSDQSLHLHRSLSRVSSLGDDTRFETVQEQVNNRMKAIKDSWQDSSIRLPSFPAFSGINFDSFKPDFTFSGRNNQPSIDRRPSNSYRNGSGVGVLSPTLQDTQQDARAIGKSVTGGPTKKSALTHPHFSKTCAELEGDLVILGGYRGSILRSAEPPHHQLWVPIKVGLNIRKVDLELGLNLEDDENSESKIIPGGILANIGPVDISRRLFRRLRATDNAKSGRLRVHDYGYDWRLDPLVLSRKQNEFIEKLPCNQPGTPKHKRGATVIAHSLGGLITMHAVNQRPDLYAGVVYAGCPFTSCVNILGPLRNGDDVLLSSRVLTAQVNFTVRTSYALLPLSGRCFFNRETKEEYPVDFFDINTWIENRLSPCIARPLPPLTQPPSTGILSTLSNAIPDFPGRRASVSFFESAKNTISHPKERTIGGIAKPDTMNAQGPESEQSVSSGNISHQSATARTSLEPSGMDHGSASPSVATAVTLPRDKAIAYLDRTLKRVKQFKLDQAFRPEHKEINIYPPAAVIYGKSTPTVYGARVRDREAIKHADAYDDLAFASGDGVVLARAAMLPEGYQAARGGVISSERGHVTLLGDLEAIGRAVNAIHAARQKGVGLGLE